MNHSPAKDRGARGTWCLLLVGLLSTLNAAAPSGTAAPPATERNQDAFFNVVEDYRRYYAEYEPLCFTAITPGTSGAFGLRFGFDSNLPGFRHVESSEDGKSFRVLKDNALFIPFDEKADVGQDRTFWVRPVSSSPGKEIVYAIHINWMTRQAFAKAGGFRKSDIVKVSSEPRMSLGTNKPENWKTFKATKSDVAFAQKQWGHLLRGVTSDYEKAKIMTKALIRELGPHGGLPQAFLYDLPTVEKYLAITSGKTGHACAQYSEIFSMACNAFGVTNRWGFVNDGLQSKDVLIELGTSHLVTEIFDRELNQWVFIDGRYSTLGAYLGDVGPLTLHEFLLFMNQPNRRAHLKVRYYDSAKDREEMIRADDNPKPYNSYLGWTKGYHTTYRGAVPVDGK